MYLSSLFGERFKGQAPCQGKGVALAAVGQDEVYREVVGGRPNTGPM